MVREAVNNVPTIPNVNLLVNLSKVDFIRLRLLLRFD